MSAGSPHASGLILTMNKYTKEEIEIFRNMLLNKFALNTTLGRIYVTAKSKPVLKKLVEPYLHNTRKTLFK